VTRGPVGMVFDRALTPELLSVALRVATESGGSPDARRLLTIALRDHVSPQEAKGKMKKCLSRVWVNPPANAREMIRWAIDHQHLDVDGTVLHMGAVLATFPFAGVVAAIVGRQLHLEGAVDPRRVRAEARVSLGDRSSVDVGARKVVTTMRYLGLLAGPSRGPLGLGRQPTVDSALLRWVTHAVLLTRQVGAVGVDEPSRALELATLKLGDGQSDNYPFLELHVEGARIIATPRVTASDRRVNVDLRWPAPEFQGKFDLG